MRRCPVLRHATYLLCSVEIVGSETDVLTKTINSTKHPCHSRIGGKKQGTALRRNGLLPLVWSGAGLVILAESQSNNVTCGLDCVLTRD